MEEAEREWGERGHLRKHPKPNRKKRIKRPGKRKKITDAQKVPELVVSPTHYFPIPLDPFPSSSSSTFDPRQAPKPRPQEQKNISSLPHFISLSLSGNSYCKGNSTDNYNGNSGCRKALIGLPTTPSQKRLTTLAVAAPTVGEEEEEEEEEEENGGLDSDLYDDGIGSKINKKKKTNARQTTASSLGPLDFGTSTPQKGEKRQRRRGKPLSCLNVTETEDPSFSEPTNEAEAHPQKDEKAAMATASAKRRRKSSDDKPPSTNRRKKKKKKKLRNNNESQQLQLVSPFFHNNKAISSTENQTRNPPSLPNPLIKEKINRILRNSPFSRSSSLPGEDVKTIEEKADNDQSKRIEDCNGVPNEAEKASLLSSYSNSYSYGTAKVEERPDAEDAGIGSSPSKKTRSSEQREEPPEKVRLVSSYFQVPTLTVQQQQLKRKDDNTSLKPHSKAKTRRPSQKKVVVVSPYFCNVATKGEEGESDDEFTSTSWNSEFKKRSTNAPALSASQKLDEAYRRVTPDNQWKPPRSHFPLLQEDHVHDPWRVLVICMLLNRTSGAQVCS